MSYEFSLGWFFIGILIVAVGAAFMRWHQVIADNFGSGVISYERYKLYALIAVGLGLIVAVNLHTTIMSWLVRLIFPTI